jgi:cell wall-associated NlpC family hydrolase
MNSKILLAREIAMSYLGTFYTWGGDDPSGFDCSGFCIEILKSVGLFPRNEDATSAMLFDKYPPTTTDQLGNLVFYRSASSDKIIHIEFGLGEGLSIGASGGGSSTTDIKKAISQNAFIKIRPWNTRSHMAGFRDPFAELR